MSSDLATFGQMSFNHLSFDQAPLISVKCHSDQVPGSLTFSCSVHIVLYIYDLTFNLSQAFMGLLVSGWILITGAAAAVPVVLIVWLLLKVSACPLDLVNAHSWLYCTQALQTNLSSCWVFVTIQKVISPFAFSLKRILLSWTKVLPYDSFTSCGNCWNKT